MPLLSRLFGRKQRDDDKTPTAEWPLGAQPLGDQSFGAAPVAPDPSAADDAEGEPGNTLARFEVPTDDAADETDAEALAAGEALSENESARSLGLANQEEESGAPGGGAFEAQSVPLEAGEGLLQVPGADDNHDASSNGGVAGLETAAAAFSSRATATEEVKDQPLGEGTERFGLLAKESADAFEATGDPVDTFPPETSTPGAPFNALAAASADAFEMPGEEISDQFAVPTAQAGAMPADTLFKSPAARSNPFMKLVAETHEITEAPDSLVKSEDEPTPAPGANGTHLDLVQPAHEAARLTTVAVPSADTEPHTLIGGEEDDLVPVIPDTATDETAIADIDESGIAEAAVVSLKGACDFLVARVKKLSMRQDATRMVAGLIALVGELDARYALDMGIRRRNGVEELLIDVRRRMAEGDRFVLESLENGRGGLTADAFLRDLKTIAPGDRPRMLGHYVVFLTFMIKRVLHQYLRSLEEDQTRTYEISYHLDYLVEGIRDMLMSKVSVGAS